ncbi:hypothetical protein GIB67_041184 [Kingdonia uniflora]|uniref:Sec1 family domain-containing protein MIP3 n=1 Tax=Kingdonia uniflora TaxID=39325 RepID=A0A7J7LKD6_9MAGN|nr:hypothetical protein GIB67_041184 [Kingdonia uniflora]
MAVADVIRSSLDSIRQISEHLKDTIIYLDAGCTEAFQFLGAFPLLLELGASAVCSLENINSLDTVANWNSNSDDAKKLVVITSRLLSDAHRYILRCLSAHHGVHSCTIFTAISEIAHSAYTDSPLGPDAFREYKSLLLQDYEELVRKCERRDHTSPRFGRIEQLNESNLSDRSASEDEGWSQLTPSNEKFFDPETSPSGRNMDENNPTTSKEDGWLRLIVSVHHFPMILCPLSPRAFVLPSEGTIAEASLSNEHEDSICPGLPPISTGLLSDGEETPPGAILTAHFLYHLAAKMDLKLEIFSIGDSSKTIGKILMDMSSLYDVGRRKRSAGLLLIDRTLDLITPCSHGDSLVDRMSTSLPHREHTPLSHVIQSKHGYCVPRTPLDVQIPLGRIVREADTLNDDILVEERIDAFLRGWNSTESGENCCETVQSHIESLSGSLVSTYHYQGAHFLDSLLERRTKDGVLLIKKWLQEILRKEKLSVNGRIRPGRPSTAELHSMVTALVKEESCLFRNKGIVQLAKAAVLALSEPHNSKWDAFVSAETILRVNAGDTSQSLFAQIRDLINKSVLLTSHEHGLLSFQDTLLLAIMGYILAGENFPTSGSKGPFSWEEEHFLKEAIVDAVLENPKATTLKFLIGLENELEANLHNIKSKKPKEDSSNQSASDEFDEDGWGNWGEEDTNHKLEDEYCDMQLKLELRDRVDNLFRFFHKLSSLKTRNIPLREGPLALERNFGGDPSMDKGLLFKLLTLVLEKHEVPGLEYHSSTVGRLFKSGFGRFGLGQAKPSLGDQTLILVFVVGGITGHEVFQAQESLSQSGRPDVELIIGGTSFLTPDDMLDLLLGSSSYI